MQRRAAAGAGAGTGLGHLPCKQDPHLSGGWEEPVLHKPQLDEIAHEQFDPSLIPAGCPASLEGKGTGVGGWGEMRTQRTATPGGHYAYRAWAPAAATLSMRHGGGAGAGSGVPESSPRCAQGVSVPPHPLTPHGGQVLRMVLKVPSYHLQPPVIL